MESTASSAAGDAADLPGDLPESFLLAFKLPFQSPDLSFALRILNVQPMFDYSAMISWENWQKDLRFAWFCDIFAFAGQKPASWGISTVGSALHSHCRGHRFESGMLHHPWTLILIQS